ncbi:MAG: hypothetical protein K6U80_20405, partial [Firmicutes bacterium]|nr:hypothetical protein [Bacillota bacterium]
GEGAPLSKAPVIPGFEWASSNRPRWGWRRRPGQKIGPQLRRRFSPSEIHSFQWGKWPPVRSGVPRQTAAFCRGWPVGAEDWLRMRQAGKPGLSFPLQFRLARLVGGVIRCHGIPAG